MPIDKEPWAWPPCPHHILDITGFSFAMGVAGGSSYHFLKGMYKSPRGERMFGGWQAVRMNALRVGGRFGVWGALFTTCGCTMRYVRQKADPWDSILPGAAASGLLSMRRGLRVASRSALVEGLCFAMIEGVAILGEQVNTKSLRS